MTETKQTILIIEDEPMICRLMDRLLTKTGYEVLTAETGTEGIGKFREHIEDISLVILDMSLPKLNGAEVLKILRQEKPGSKVLLSSGWVPAEVDALFADNRPDGFLPKPFQTTVLLQKVEELLK
ncbi:MAG TPA: response regulator [Kiritimatiellia bacterium]|nr:response regulator [Kiritimatiellia bacterium]HNS81442.1 response regulator [Kiritimatiellia bacterium]